MRRYSLLCDNRGLTGNELRYEYRAAVVRVAPIQRAFLSHDRERAIERGASIQLRLDPDPSAAAFYDALADRKTNTGAGNFIPVQALEDAENSLVILRVDADAIVGHRQP